MSTNESSKLTGTAKTLLVNKPRTRQRLHKEPPALDVPDINDDAAERKRVLNVLAQRRYREKKRQSRKIGSGTASKQSGEVAKDDCLESGVTTSTTCEQDVLEDTPFESLEATSTVATDGLVPRSKVLSWDMGSLDASSPSLILGIDDLATNDSAMEEQRGYGVIGDSSSGSASSVQSQGSVDPQANFNFDTLSPSETLTDGIDLSFPDSYLLPVNELALMRAFFRIAARLDCKANIFDLYSLSPFADSSKPVSHLPQTWQPTAAQILIPHHPILDFLPWPSVRERIIYTLTLPEHMRPSVAKDPAALVHFAHDLDDSAEGIRVWGSDVYDPSSWEVGQQLFERWWFLFDRRIIEQSNVWRTLRGAARLRVNGAGAGAGCGNGQYSAGLAI